MKKVNPLPLHRKTTNTLHYILLALLCILLPTICSGCTPNLPVDREDSQAKTNRSEKEMANERMQSVLDALDAQDADALKELFSDYALENADDLDGKIEELLDFYPGCNGGYEGNVPAHRTSDYGDITYVLTPKYSVTHNGEIYEMRLTMYIESDAQPERIGLHSIQVMTEDARPDGFKWRDEEDAPGVYVFSAGHP